MIYLSTSKGIAYHHKIKVTSSSIINAVEMCYLQAEVHLILFFPANVGAIARRVELAPYTEDKIYLETVRRSVNFNLRFKKYFI